MTVVIILFLLIFITQLCVLTVVIQHVIQLCDTDVHMDVILMTTEEYLG